MEKKRIDLEIFGLLPDNIEKIFERNFLNWLYYKSEKVTINGIEIAPEKRVWTSLTKPEGIVETNDKKNGLPLTREQFTNQQIKKFTAIYEETKGSIRNHETNVKAGLYLEFLKNNSETKTTEILIFESLFYKAANAEECLSVLRKLAPPVIDVENNYIGKGKGIFPIWVNTLKQAGWVKHFTDKEYKDVLNNKIKGLNLSKDASEFRKTYKRLSDKPQEIKALLSQLSQAGKIGK